MAMPFEQAPEAFHPVERPQHYAFGGIEAIEGIEASMSAEAYRGFCKGNVLKYVWRYESKNGLEDLEKAKWYLNQLIFALETDQEREALAAIENNVECTDGFCPIPGIRYDLPGKQVLFDPVDKA
jgi:hypothetical protein